MKIGDASSTETLLSTVHTQKCGKKKQAPLLVLICVNDVVWQVEKFSIIQVQDCICNVVQNRRIVILLNVEVSSPFFFPSLFFCSFLLLAVHEGD